MILSSLRKLLSLYGAAPTRSAASRPLRLETLEERAVPATFTVNPGPGSPLQTAINAAAASPGADTILVNAGTYNEAVTVNDPSALTLKANGAVTLASPTHLTPSSAALGAALVDVYSKNVTVDGFTVDGSTNADGNLYAGIRVLNNGSATIQNNTVTGTTSSLGGGASGFGIQIGTINLAGDAGKGTAKVADNTVNNYYGAGVLVTNNSSATVQDNTITGRGLGNGGVAQYGVQVSYQAAAQVSGNTISGNDVDGPVPGGSDPSSTSAGILFFQVTNADAKKNDVSGNDVGIFVQQSSGGNHEALEVEQNKVTGNNGFAGIVVRDSHTLEVEGNTVANNGTFNGIALSGSNDVEVAGNRVHGNASDGIYLFGSHDNEIEGNNSSGNGGSGIFLEQSSTNEVEGNEARSNQQDGIRVLGGSGNSIRNNRLRNNCQDGIALDHSDNNRLADDETWSNGGNGVHLFFSSSNTITDVDVRSSGANGFLIDGGQRNTLHDVDAVRNQGDGIRLKDTHGTTIKDSESRCNGGDALNQSHATDTTIQHSTLIDGCTFYVSCPRWWQEDGRGRSEGNRD